MKVVQLPVLYWFLSITFEIRFLILIAGILTFLFGNHNLYYGCVDTYLSNIFPSMLRQFKSKLHAYLKNGHVCTYKQNVGLF